MEDRNRLTADMSSQLVRRDTMSAYPVEYVDYGSQGDSEDESGSGAGVREYIAAVRQRKLLIGIVALLGATIGYLVQTMPAAPNFQAKSTIQLAGQSSPIDFGDGPGGDMVAFLQSQSIIMMSDKIQKRVVEKVSQTPRENIVTPPGRVWRMIRRLGIPVEDSVVSPDDAIDAARANLAVTPKTRMGIIDIETSSPDREVAADYLNVLVSEYSQYSLQNRWDNAQRTNEFMSQQLEEVRRRLQYSESALQDFSIRTGIGSIGYSASPNNLVASSVAEQRQAQIQQELSLAQADRTTKQTRHEMLSAPDATADMMDSPLMVQLQQRLATLKQDMADLLTMYTKDHYRVQRAQASIDATEQLIAKERDNIVIRAKTDFEQAIKREDILRRALEEQTTLVGEQSQSRAQYEILKYEVASNRQLYDQILQQTKQYSVTSAMQGSNVYTIDPAEPRSAPVSRNPMLAAAVGMLAGAFVVIGGVVLREKLDQRLKTPGRTATLLRIPELGVIPSAAFAGPKPGRRFSLLPGRNGTPAGVPVSAGAGAVELLSWRDKGSMVAESFRATLASILFSYNGGVQPKVIVVSSPHASEGKTTAVSNLGIALAEINRKVLVIDGDMRKPRLHSVFDIANSWGLSDLLRERNSIKDSPLEALARSTEVPGLYVLPAGPGTTSVASLIYSPRMAELLQRFRQEFDTIIIDSPPVLQVSDARVLGKMSDGVILVFRAGSTAIDNAVTARSRFAEDGTRLLGTLLNDWNPKVSGYGNGYYGYYSSSARANA